MNSEVDESVHHIDVMPEKLYAEDAGQLPFEARRVFVQLLSGPAIDGKRHPKLWHGLLNHEAVLRVRLSDLFLELVLDYDQEVAFTKQADVGDLEAPILLRRVKLTFLSSVLMLYLRQLLLEAEAQSLRAVVDEADMIEQMYLYEKSQSKDAAGFRKRTQAAIENAKKHNFLLRIENSKDRYEISPTLKLLFGADEVIALQKQYEKIISDEVSHAAN